MAFIVSLPAQCNAIQLSLYLQPISSSVAPEGRTNSQ